jgi:hypothetical protein
MDLQLSFHLGPDILDDPVTTRQAQLLDVYRDGRYLVRCDDTDGFRLDPVDNVLTRAYIQGALDRAASLRRT